MLYVFYHSRFFHNTGYQALEVKTSSLNKYLVRTVAYVIVRYINLRLTAFLAISGLSKKLDEGLSPFSTSVKAAPTVTPNSLTQVSNFLMKSALS